MSRRTAGSVSLSAVPRSADRISPAQSDLDAALANEDELDFPIEELREFVSADLYEVPADPLFKEQLRERLWGFLRQRIVESADSGGD